MRTGANVSPQFEWEIISAACFFCELLNKKIVSWTFFLMAFLGLSPPSAPSFFEVGASRLPESLVKLTRVRWC